MNKLENTEVEISFPLQNPKEVIEKLKDLGAEEKETEYQKDTYYIPSHKNFLEQKPISDWLRIRETKKEATVNFKHWHNDGLKQAVSCDEYQTKVGDAESIKNIFKQLDIKEIIVVEKNRRKWNYKDIEVALDDVTELGSFIELEVIGDFSSVREAEKYLYEVLKELDAKIGKQDYRGYPYLILEKNGYKFE